MSDVAVDFDWACDLDGYQLVSRPRLAKGEETVAMFGGMRQLREDQLRPIYIVRNGKKTFPNRPLGVSDLYLTFAKLAKTPKGALEFVERWGPLTHAGHRPHGELVGAIIAHAVEMSNCVEILSDNPANLRQFMAIGQFASVAVIETVLRFENPHERPLLSLRPKELRDALWLQFGQAAAGGADIRVCRHCGGWFEAGGSEGLRRDAKFCKSQHRIDFNNERRKRKS